MGQRVLMIAYHFPPLGGSSGIQRTLRFVQHLPKEGWEPMVLGASPRAFERLAPDLENEVPAGTIVRRAFARDTARHLSIKGRYPGILARPDRWISWWPHAVWEGLGMIRKYRPAAIWSTYPIPTAHLIGRALARLSGLPWIADFRDPMAQENYPADIRLRRALHRIEAETVKRATATVLTTRGAAALYRERHPASADRIHLIENGFDEESFANAPQTFEPLVPGTITLLHSGIVYPSERDPSALLEALARLQEAGAISPSALRIRFRAPVHGGLVEELAKKFRVAAFIETLPAVPYQEALAEMLRADGLLVLQAANCNQQIPAKVYEYLRAGRPILGLTAPEGDTADLLRRASVAQIAPLDSATEIATALGAFVADIQSGRARPPATELVTPHSRASRTRELAALLCQVTGCP